MVLRSHLVLDGASLVEPRAHPHDTLGVPQVYGVELIKVPWRVGSHIHREWGVRNKSVSAK